MGQDSFRNLAFPLDWESIFEYVGFPAYFKPFAGGGWKSVYKVNNPEELFKAYNETNQLVMMLQEEIKFDEYYRCYSLDRRDVWIMPYEPRNPHHLRYIRDGKQLEAAKQELLKGIVLKINRALGYDFNTVELAVRDGIPYVIDFCNPAPDAELASVGEENFEWIVENAANMAIRRAKMHRARMNNLTWRSSRRDRCGCSLRARERKSLCASVAYAPGLDAAQPDSSTSPAHTDPDRYRGARCLAGH